MTSSGSFHFHDEGALLDRLTRGLKKRSQEVVFLVGSPLCYPQAPGLPGVPGVEGVIDLIRNEFDDDPSQKPLLETDLSLAGDLRYQTAFAFLLGRRGQHTANEIIRRAVCAARSTQPETVDIPQNQATIDEECRLLEYDVSNWILTPGMEALGKLIAGYPGRFGRSILTTNFDPLIEAAIRCAGGNYFRTTLHSDGNFSQTTGNGCHVVHLHGYWYGSDTLHTSRQLGQPRPHLRDSLTNLLRDRLVVVCGYGGWDDSFTEAMMAVVRDDTSFPEIIWTFHSGKPTISEKLSQRLAPGIDRGRVNLYAAIDCQRIFPQLREIWSDIEKPATTAHISLSNPVRIDEVMRTQLAVTLAAVP